MLSKIKGDVFYVPHSETRSRGRKTWGALKRFVRVSPFAFLLFTNLLRDRLTGTQPLGSIVM